MKLNIILKSYYIFKYFFIIGSAHFWNKFLSSKSINTKDLSTWNKKINLKPNFKNQDIVK